MTKRNFNSKGHSSRPDRIERKCDRILSELLIIRHMLSKRPSDVDAAIERMHRAARKMRAQCEKEREIAREMLITKSGRR